MGGRGPWSPWPDPLLAGEGVREELEQGGVTAGKVPGTAPSSKKERRDAIDLLGLTRLWRPLMVSLP